MAYLPKFVCTQAVRVALALMLGAGLIPLENAHAQDRTTGLELCDRTTAINTPAASRYVLGSQTLELPLVFIPGAGWYRANLQVAAGSNFGFEVKELANSCQNAAEPAAYIASTQTLLVPSLEIASDTGVVSKYDLRLKLQPETGRFVPTDFWDTDSDTGVAPSQSQSRSALQPRNTNLVDAVQLDAAVGFYPAGSIVPLARITGARVGNSEPGCTSKHLHGGPAFFNGGGPYNDPNPNGCGYGKVISVQADSIDHGVINVATPTGKDYCGPDITNVFFDRLKLMASRLTALPDSERGLFDGTMFLARNGGNMDFAVGSMSDPANNAVCPTGNCSGSGHTSTITLCGQCMIAHIANDIEYGFVAHMLGVPRSVQLAGAHAWDITQTGNLDPLPSQMAYRVGNQLAAVLKATPTATNTHLCTALQATYLRVGVADLRISTKMFTDEMSAFGKGACQPCPYGCPVELIKKDFSVQSWLLDNGARDTYTP